MKCARHDLRGEIICDLRFLDDDDRITTMIGLMELVLKAMTLDAHLIKR
jgi:hypothetical protein